MQVSLTDLPNNVLNQILNFIPYSKINSVLLVNKKLNKLQETLIINKSKEVIQRINILFIETCDLKNINRDNFFEIEKFIPKAFILNCPKVKATLSDIDRNKADKLANYINQMLGCL